MSSGARWAAFMRGINLGGRRVDNPTLERAISDADGVTEVSVFLASGNAVLTDELGRGRSELAESLAAAIAANLGFESWVAPLTAAEVRALAEREPFTAKQLDRSRGKPQVVLFQSELTARQREVAMGFSTGDDPIVVADSALFWLPRDGVSASDLDFGALERAVGPTTVRTQNTIRRLGRRFFE